MSQGQIAEKNTRLTIILPKELKSKATKIAESDGRTLSGWVRKLIDDAVDEFNKNNQ